MNAPHCKRRPLLRRGARYASWHVLVASIALFVLFVQDTDAQQNPDELARKVEKVQKRLGAIELIGNDLENQEEEAQKEERRFKNFAVSESRYVEELLMSAQQLIENRDWVGGVSQLQDVMNRYGNKVHPLKGRSVIYRSYRERCLEALRNLPPRGLDAYRSQFDPQAKDLFDQGRRQKDASFLTEVIRRFPLTSYADDAMLCLGDIYQERGELSEALYYYQRILSEMEGSDSDHPETFLRAAYCSQRLGNLEELQSLRTRLSQRHPSSRVRYRGKSLPTEDLISRWIELTREQRENQAQTSWDMIAGNPARNRPLSKPQEDAPLQWEHSLPSFDFGRNRRSYQSYKDQTHHKDAQVYPVHPVVSSNSVIFHNGSKVQALDLYVGRQKWEYEPPDRDLSEQSDTRQIFSGVIENDTYFVNLEVSPEVHSWDWRHGPILVPIPMRKIFALSSTTGELRWTHRGFVGKDLEETRFIRELSITSPPLVTRNTVYAVGSLFEGKIHCYVCAFDARDGSLLWRTLICTGQQELNMFGRPLLEHVASMLAEDRGTLYFSTNLGLVAAVDSRLGTIRWISEYRSIDMPLNQGFNFLVRRFVFANLPPIIAGERLLCAPMDSEELYCFDRKTGKTHWKRNVRSIPGGFSTVLGEQDGLVVVGGSAVTGLELQSGKKRWSYPLRPRSKVAGLGGLAHGLALCPTKDGLVAVDLKTGRPVPEVLSEVNFGAGNLVVTDRFTVQAGYHHLSVCYRWAEVFQALQDRIAARPDDPLVYLEVGNIYRQGKEYSEAASNYKKAIALADRDPAATEVMARATAGLYATYMSLGDQAWGHRKLKTAVKWYSQAERYAQTELAVLNTLLAFVRYYEASGNSQKLTATYEDIFERLPKLSHNFSDSLDSIPAGLYALLSLAEHHIRLGMPERAVATFQRIIRHYPNESYQETSAHVFATHKISELMARHGSEIYAPFETDARNHFDRAKKTRDIKGLRTVVKEYPNSPVVQPSLVLLADLLTKSGEYLEAVEVLRRFLITFPESSLTDEVLEKLGHCYAQSGHHAAAKKINVRLNYDRYAPKEPGRGLARLSIPPNKLWNKAYNRSIGLHLLRINDLGETPITDRFFFQSNRTLSCASIETGEILWSTELSGRLSPQATIIDRLLFVNSSRSMAAVDPADGKIVWEEEPDGLVRDFKVVPGTVLAVVENREQAGVYNMRALDALGGLHLWERNFKGSLYGHLVVTENFVSTYSTKPVTMITIDPFDNSRQFEYAVGPQYMHPTPLERNRIFVFKQNELRVLDLDRKTVAWEKKTRSERENVKHAVGLGERVAVLLSERNEKFYLSLLEGESGHQHWRTELPPGHILPARPIEAEGGKMIFLNRRTEDLSYRLLAIRTSDGSIAWETPPFEGKTLPRRVLETQDHVVVERNFIEDSELRNVVLVCDKTTGQVAWQWDHSGNYTSEVALVGDTLLISLANQVEAYGR